MKFIIFVQYVLTLSIYYSEKYLFFYILAFLSEVLGTVSGFGSSILFVPIAAYFFDFHSVLGITALFHVFSNTSKIMLFRQGIDWTIVKWLGVSSILFVIVGAALSKYVPVKELELGLSIFMIAISLFLLLQQWGHLSPNRNNLMLGGSLSGLIAGLVGTGGALRGLTLSAFALEKNSFIATSALIDMGVDSSRLLVYLYNGYVKSEFLYLILPLILISISGSYTGRSLLYYIPEKWFQRIVLILILLVALVQLIQVLSK